MTALRGRDQQSCSEGEDAADSSGVVVCHHHLTITLMCLYLASGGGHADTENIQSHLAFLKVLLFSFFQSRGKNILYWLMKQQLHPKFHLGAVMFLGSLIIIFFPAIFLFVFLSTIEQYFSCVIPFWVWRLLTPLRWIPFSAQSEGEKIKLLCYLGLSDLHILSPSQSTSSPSPNPKSLTGYEGNRMTRLGISLSNELKRFDKQPCCWFDFQWKLSLSHIAGRGFWRKTNHF